MKTSHEHYYVPSESAWPIISTVALFLLALGGGIFVNSGSSLLFLSV